MATSGKAWRKAREEGIEITLISGNVVAIRPLDIDFFLREGRVPDFLASTVNRLIEGVETKPPDEEQAEKNLTEWMPFLNRMVTAAFVNPRIVENPTQDDEISIDDVRYLDKLMLYRLFLRPVAVLRSFRAKSAEPVATVDAPQDNGDTPQQGVSGGNSAVGEPTVGNA
jgi:hypothetical protein